MIKYGHWKCSKFEPDDHFGFVYTIINKVTGRVYIGQKQLHFTLKRPPLKGRKNKRHYKKESDWRTYTGSSKSLNADIDKLGKRKFQFNIVSLCDSKWDLSYTEYSKIINENAIPDRSYYNEFLGRIGRPGEKDKDKYDK